MTTSPSIAAQPARRAVATTHDPLRLLRRALQVDAAGSALAAIPFLLGGAALAERLGSPVPLAPIGAFFLVWAGALAWLAARESIRPAAAWAVVALNALWVVGTAIEIAAGLFSPLGKLVFGGMALFVLAVADAQFLGILRLNRARR